MAYKVANEKANIKSNAMRFPDTFFNRLFQFLRSLHLQCATPTLCVHNRSELTQHYEARKKIHSAFGICIARPAILRNRSPSRNP